MASYDRSGSMLLKKSVARADCAKIESRRPAIRIIVAPAPGCDWQPVPAEGTHEALADVERRAAKQALFKMGGRQAHAAWRRLVSVRTVPGRMVASPSRTKASSIAFVKPCASMIASVAPIA
jgi:hypothetical protein